MRLFLEWTLALSLIGCSSLDSENEPLGGSEPRASVAFALPGDPCGSHAQCNDGNDCTADKCKKGVCENTSKADGASCSDGENCTQSDRCLAGTCRPGMPVVCAPPNQCQQAAGCAANGRCSYTPLTGAACDDGNACTVEDACNSAPGGVCVGRAVTDGTTCDDGDPNTVDDVCSAGTCAGVNRCGVVSFADPELEALIRNALAKPIGPISGDDVLVFTALHAPDAGIEDLTGLECFTNLTQLFLAYNYGITDLSPLASLTNLSWVSLHANAITDISPLAGLTNLTFLDLSYNWDLEDISPLSSLTGLRELGLTQTLVSDLAPLSALGELGSLLLDFAQVADLSPLAGLSELSYLSLFANQVSDLSALSGLGNLSYLGLSHNLATDIGALGANAGLGSGDQIYVDSNPLDCAAQNANLQALVARGATVHTDCVLDPLLGLALEPPAGNVNVGETVAFNVYAYYASDPTTAVDVTDDVSWLIQTGNATVNDGIVSGLVPGSDVVVASLDGENASGPLRVWDAAHRAQLTGITVIPPGGEITVGHGGCLQYSATGHFADGPDEDLTATVTWHLAVPGYGVARTGLTGEGFVAPGLFAANGFRTQYVGVDASLDGVAGVSTAYVGGISAQQFFAEACADPRSPGELWGLEIEAPSSELMVGEAVPLAAYGLYSDGSRRLVREPGLVWSVSDGSPLEVTVDGWVTGTATGSGEAVVTLGAVTASTPADVVSQSALGSLLSISIQPSAFNAAAGSPFSMQALASYSGAPGRLINVTATASWSSDEPLVADVVAGAVFAGEPGVAGLQAELAGVAGQGRVGVWQAAELDGLSAIAVEPWLASVTVGECFQFSALATLADGSSIDVSDLLVWTTSHPALGSVADGLFAANGSVASGYHSVEAFFAPLGLHHTGTVYLVPSGGESSACPAP